MTRCTPELGVHTHATPLAMISSATKNFFAFRSSHKRSLPPPLTASKAEHVLLVESPCKALAELQCLSFPGLVGKHCGHFYSHRRHVAVVVVIVVTFPRLPADSDFQCFRWRHGGFKTSTPVPLLRGVDVASEHQEYRGWQHLETSGNLSFSV